MKNVKMETVAEFMARGGKINKIPASMGKRGYNRMKAVSKVDLSEIDMSALPEALRIKYGVK